jgi:hypothetical protein
MIDSLTAAARLPQTDPDQAQPDKSPLDAYMAVGVDDHRAANGPQLVERFARLWPRAARARRRRPAALRRITLDPGIPGQPRWRLDYLLDVIYNRDLWLHRVDLARATGRPFVLADHDRQIAAQVVRDLGRAWSAAPVALELTGPAGGCWLLGSGDPVAVVRAEVVAYIRPGRARRRRGAGAGLRAGVLRAHPHPPGPSRLLIAWFIPSTGSAS